MVDLIRLTSKSQILWRTLTLRHPLDTALLSTPGSLVKMRIELSEVDAHIVDENDERIGTVVTETLPVVNLIEIELDRHSIRVAKDSIGSGRIRCRTDEATKEIRELPIGIDFPVRPSIERSVLKGVKELNDLRNTRSAASRGGRRSPSRAAVVLFRNTNVVETGALVLLFRGGNVHFEH